MIPWFDVFFPALPNSYDQDDIDEENDGTILTGQIQLLRMIINFTDKDNLKLLFKKHFITDEENKFLDTFLRQELGFEIFRPG